MMVTILLFAQLQEEVGKDRIEMDVPEITVEELKIRAKETYKLSHIDQVMVAINEEYAFNDDTVKSGDIVAFIPPVSGG